TLYGDRSRKATDRRRLSRPKGLHYGCRRAGVQACLIRRVSAPRAHAVRPSLAQLDPNRMPAAVSLHERWIAEVILLAQLVGDAGGGRVQIARLTDDFSAAAAVVRHVAQRRDVHAVVARPAARRRPDAALRERTAADGSGQR